MSAASDVNDISKPRALSRLGGVVAFISGIVRLTDPWGDLVNYFRDLSVTEVGFKLLAEAMTVTAESTRTSGD